MKQFKMKLKHFAFAGMLGLFTACSLEDPVEPGSLVPMTVDEDASLPSLEINGTNLHLETFGDSNNPVLIFLHGGPGGDYRSMLRLADRYNGYSLSDEYFCVFYDQRGAGLSRRHGNLKEAFRAEVAELSLDTYLADLNAIVDHFSPNDPVILMGHSWGGMHATQYINVFPSRVAAVIMSEPGGFNSETDAAIDNINIELLKEGLNDVMWGDQILSPKDHELADYRFISSVLTADPIKEYHFELDESLAIKFWRYGAVATMNDFGDAIDDKGNYHYDFTDNLSAFTTKALFINGSLNEIITVDFQEGNRSYYPNSELHVIQDVGHDLMWIKAQEHVELMRTYLDEVL